VVNVRFSIVDAIRGLLALVVALGHFGMPPLFGAVDVSDVFLRNLARFWRTLAFGPPAVVAFFVISGFCIHFAFAAPGTKVPVVRFYSRRYLRIGVPVFVVVVLLWFFRPNFTVISEHGILWNSTLWSILCEEIYYAFYPLIQFSAIRFGMRAVFLASLPPSLAVIALNWPSVDWTQVGVIGTTITLFPIWLLGAFLAVEARAGKLPSVSPSCILSWRLGAGLTMWFSLVLHFHSIFHQTISCLPVGVYAYFWLRAELGRSRLSSPSAFLVSFGAASYSLYLVHPLVIDAFIWLEVYVRLPPLVTWALGMALILAGSRIFYILVEAPSHRLARRISLRGKSTVSSIEARIA
jgi:peptidoglycan/LPS O-acetylase OafA/YrhL